MDDWREGLPPEVIFQRECLGRWVVNYNGGDAYRIKRFIEQWGDDKKKLVAQNDWFRVVVREQYKLLKVGSSQPEFEQ